MKYTVIRENPETLQSEALLQGEPVPAWAKDLVHADDLESSSKSQSSSGSSGPDYSKMTPAELQGEADKRELEVEGSGANGNVVKADLVSALEADDAENA